MSPTEIISIVAGLVSVIVGIIAGGLAIFFYIKQKEDATRVEVALAEIREQTNALQSISSGFLDRLTKYVTTTPKSPPHQDPGRIVIDTLRGIPEIVQMLRIPNVVEAGGATDGEMTRILAALRCYTAETNYWAGFFLPPAGEFDDNKGFHGLIQSVVDRSFSDYEVVSGMIESCDLDEISSEPIGVLHRETIEALEGSIGDTAFHFRRIAKPDPEDNEEG